MALDLTDKTANGNTLTNVNTCTESSTTPFAASTASCDFEQTSSQYLYAEDSASLSITSDFTIEMWVNYETNAAEGDGYNLIFKGDDYGTSSFFVYLYNSDTWRIHLAVWNGSTRENKNVVISEPSAATWYHYAIVWTAASHKYELYVNGSSVGTDTGGAVTSITDTDKRVYIGKNSSAIFNTYFDGKMDEIRIWSDVRTATEITNNKDIRLTGTEANLVAYYPFEALSSLKSVNGLAYGSIKSKEGLAKASIKNINGLA